MCGFPNPCFSGIAHKVSGNNVQIGSVVVGQDFLEGKTLVDHDEVPGQGPSLPVYAQSAVLAHVPADEGGEYNAEQSSTDDMLVGNFVLAILFIFMLYLVNDFVVSFVNFRSQVLHFRRWWDGTLLHANWCAKDRYTVIRPDINFGPI